MEAFNDEMARQEYEHFVNGERSDGALVMSAKDVWLASWHCLRDKFACKETTK